MTTTSTIITTAVVTLLLTGLVRLAIPEARRRWRKHTRRLNGLVTRLFRTHSHKVAVSKTAASKRERPILSAEDAFASLLDLDDEPNPNWKPKVVRYSDYPSRQVAE